MLTTKYDDAFRYAHELHRTQTRKETAIPYISHLMAVSALVVEHGGNEDQAIAALLVEVYSVRFITWDDRPALLGAVEAKALLKPRPERRLGRGRFQGNLE